MGFDIIQDNKVQHSNEVEADFSKNMCACVRRYLYATFYLLCVCVDRTKIAAC